MFSPMAAMRQKISLMESALYVQHALTGYPRVIIDLVLTGTAVPGMA